MYYIDLKEKRFQRYVDLSDLCGDVSVLRVYVSNQVGKSSESVECIFNNVLGVYVCPTTLAHRYSVVSGITTITDSCSLYTYDKYFEYCGYNNTVNVFAGRMFDIPAYRGNTKYIEDQSFGTANFGCTTTDCMCNSLYGGAGCAAGVSSLRYFPTLRDELKLTQFFCGETISLPNFIDPVAGRGVIDSINYNCSCSIISNVEVTGITGLTFQYFYGKACECEYMYNEDRKMVMSCAGHGVCKESWFPYGVCEADMDRYVADALYTPYVEKKSSAVGFNKMTVTEDMYILRFSSGDSLGTAFPTELPTKRPSAAPTSAPTTLSPTQPPTTQSPTTRSPTTQTPTKAPSTQSPTQPPTTQTPTTQSPTTAFPTTQSPTQPPSTPSPTPAPVASPTESPATPKVYLYSTNVAYAGDFTIAFAESECASAQSLVTASTCSTTTPFLTYTSHDILSFPTIFSFPTNANLYGPSGTLIGEFTYSVTTGNLVPLVSAGVFDGFYPTYWVGGDDTLYPNCDLWSEQFAPGIAGNVLSFGDALWINDGNIYGCDTMMPLGCFCVGDAPIPPPTSSPTTRSPSKTPTKAPSQSPTKAPTTGTPTASPTLKPTTKSPTIKPTTKSPTQSPTKPPTRRPTTSPTNAPTTGTPTASPTNTPTIPTSSPTFDPLLNRELRYMYKIPQGTEFSVYNLYYNISISHLHSSPVNLTISPDGQFFSPVLWKNLIYRKWDIDLNVTDSKIVDYCNPGMPSWIPGEYQLQSDGYKTCPTLDKCILTVDCTDELSPTPNFPDLRACWCSYEVVTYTSISQLNPLDIINVDLFEGSAMLTSPEDVSIPDDALGSFYCNSFIDRTINCMLAKQDFSYNFKCSNEPIGCYDQSIGFFFGAFTDQNIKYTYPVNQSDWGPDHYKGVASILNNLTYHDSTWGYVDPFKTGILYDYYWVNKSTATNVIREELIVTPVFYQSYILQTDPYMYTLVDIPPPVLSVFSEMSQAEQFELCYTFSGAVTFSNLCKGLNSTFWEYKNARMPGFFGVVESSNKTFLSFESVLNHAPGGSNRIRGLEIYNSLWQKCGGVYSDEGFTEGQQIVISCLDTNTAFTNFNNSMFIFRVLGINSIYDLPGATLNNEYFPSPLDPLEGLAYINLGYYSESDICIILPLASIYDGVFGTSPVPSTTRSWPQRQWYNQTFTGIGFDVYGNYTLNPLGDVTASAWKAISDLITELNVYPENAPLQVESYLYNTKAVDYINNAYDRDYLYGIWATRLAMRHCGADSVQCLTFDLGECVMDTSYNQYWYNLGDTVNYEVIGNEGGCYCNNAFPIGFYSLPLFCGACKSGYGPYSITELSYIIQYNTLVTTVYEDNIVPSNIVNLTPTQFERYYSCRYPSGMDPIPSSLAPVNFCGGHGIVEGDNTTTSMNITVWDLVNIISCDTLASEEGTYVLNKDMVTSQFSLVYILDSDESKMLVVIGTTDAYDIYLVTSTSNVECITFTSKDTTYPYPFRLYILCGDEELSLTCGNSLFFTTSDVYIFNELVYLENPFLLYIKE